MMFWHTRFGSTLLGTAIQNFVTHIQEYEIRQIEIKKAQLELTRGFAKKLNWYAFRLHRLAVAIDNAAESKADEIAKRPQSERLK